MNPQRIESEHEYQSKGNIIILLEVLGSTKYKISLRKLSIKISYSIWLWQVLWIFQEGGININRYHI